MKPEDLIVLTPDQLRALVRDAVREGMEARAANDERAEYLTRRQLCALLGCTSASVRNWERQGLPVLYAGASPRYSREAVTAWMESRKLRAVK